MRSIALLMVGAVTGGAGVYLFGQLSAESPDLYRDAPLAGPPDESLVSASRVGSTSDASDGGLIATRIAIFERALGATDGLDLETRLDIAAAEPRSRSRDLEITALLGRLAELDPARAADYAQSSFLDPPFLIQAFEALAVADPDEAIARLGSVRPASKQRRVALALLDVFGVDEAGVRRLADAMPEANRASFEVDALLVRAELDPLAVLGQALAGELPGMSSYLLPRLAEMAAAQDPLTALALGREIRDLNLARTYEFALFGAWAGLDPDAVFAWLEAAEPAAIAGASAAFGTLARSDAERLLSMIGTFPPAARGPAQRAAMQTLAESDPMTALALIDTMPLGQDRENLVQTIARTYGRQDPETAFVWAKSLSPPSQNAVQAVLRGIAMVDVDRAIDLIIAELEAQETAGLASTVSPGSPIAPGIPLDFPVLLSGQPGASDSIGRLTDKLLEASDPGMRAMLTSTLTAWTSRDPESALAWALANAGRLDAGALRNVARGVSEENLDLAMSSLDQLPAAQRAGWIEGLASSLARSDSDQATSFLDRFRGQPGYDTAIGTVAGEMANSDPAGAARLLTQLDSPAAMQRSAPMIARQWANQDPAAAARWVLDDITDEQVQVNALRTIASSWVQRDPAAAERWIQSLGNGPSRDAAADGFLAMAAGVGRFEPRLLDVYSSEQASQRAVSRAAVAMARSNPDRARELIDMYLTDPALRAQTEEQIARTLSTGSGSLAQGVRIGL